MPAPREFDPISRKVISGPVPSLKAFATRVLSSHISALDDIGGTPYTLIAAFLAQCSAIQLGDIELRSPHIRKESRELWKRLTLADFFEVRIPYEKHEMKEPRNWRKVYIAAHEARQQKELDGKARLKDSYRALEEKREKRKLVYDPKAIKGEPAKKKMNGWSSSSSSKPSSNSIISKTREKAKGYALSFKAPVSRPLPRTRTFSNDPSTFIGSSSRASTSFVAPRRSSFDPSSASSVMSSSSTLSSSAKSKAQSISSADFSQSNHKPSSSTVPSTLTFDSILQALPPPLSYRAPSASASFAGGSSSFLGLASRPIDASERFTIPSRRPTTAEKERIVPRGCYIPAPSRDDGSTKIAPVNFFGRGAFGLSTARLTSSHSVKVSSVIVPRSGSSNGGKSRTPSESSPPASTIKEPSSGGARPAPVIPDNLTPAIASVESRLGLGGGSGPGFREGTGVGMSPPLRRKEPTSMFIPSSKRKKIVP